MTKALVSFSLTSGSVVGEIEESRGFGPWADTPATGDGDRRSPRRRWQHVVIDHVIPGTTLMVST